METPRRVDGNRGQRTHPFLLISIYRFRSLQCGTGQGRWRGRRISTTTLAVFAAWFARRRARSGAREARHPAPLTKPARKLRLDRKFRARSRAGLSFTPVCDECTQTKPPDRRFWDATPSTQFSRQAPHQHRAIISPCVVHYILFSSTSSECYRLVDFAPKQSHFRCFSNFYIASHGPRGGHRAGGAHHQVNMAARSLHASVGGVRLVIVCNIIATA